MKKSYNFIVLGLGGIGSAALYWLIRRNQGSVLGIEQFQLGHDYGASQDHSRIIRLSYDDPHYTLLTPHTFTHWREIEAESGIQLVQRTGSLVFSPGEHGSEHAIERYTDAMRMTGIPFERLSSREAMNLFPQFRLVDNDEIIYCANDGFVDPRKANAAHASLGVGVERRSWKTPRFEKS